jgi:peptide/nickel transport system substrate-binding protein
VKPAPVTAARTAAALTALATVLAGCGGQVGSASEGSPSDAGGAPVELRLAIGGEAEEGFDPTLGWGRYGSPLFQSTLLRRDADLSITHDLATAYDVSDDGLTWTVNIRSDAVFSDGEPVTADDVAYTFETASEQGGLTDVTVLEEAEAVDRDTVELRLSEPRSAFVNRLVSLGIVPEHAHDGDYAQQPVGSGPFELVSWEKGQQLVVERHEDYYGDKPAFERLVFVFTDEDATLAAARSGAVDVAAVPSAMATGDIDGMRLEAVPSIDNRGIAFPTVPDEGRTSASGAPIGDDVTADRAIRQAVNQAVDRDQLVAGVLEGFGTPATGPVDGAPWHEPSAAIEDADVPAAIDTLENAGWTQTDDGVREKDGVRAEFTLLYPAGDSLRQGLALSVVDMVEPAGIAIRTEGVSWEEIDQRLHADAVMFGWGSHDPTEMYNLYHSAQAGTELWNPGFYSNPEVDARLDDAMRALDEESANRHWRAAQVDGEDGGFTRDYPWAWLVNLDHTYFVDECLDLGELQTEPHGHGWPLTAGIESWRWTC